MALGHKDGRRPGRRVFQPTVDDRLETRVLLSSSGLKIQTAAGGQAVVVTEPSGQQFFVSVNHGTIQGTPASNDRINLVVEGSNGQYIPRNQSDHPRASLTHRGAPTTFNSGLSSPERNPQHRLDHGDQRVHQLDRRVSRRRAVRSDHRRRYVRSQSDCVHGDRSGRVDQGRTGSQHARHSQQRRLHHGPRPHRRSRPQLVRRQRQPDVREWREHERRPRPWAHGPRRPRGPARPARDCSSAATSRSRRPALSQSPASSTHPASSSSATSPVPPSSRSVR